MGVDEDNDWVPESCTLPTAQRPLRVAEFDELLATVRTSTRPEPTKLLLVMPSAAEATARELARREVQCCSFFRFTFERAGCDDVGEIVMHIGVSPDHVEVLDALETRAGHRA